jgi:hypothetical protein
MKIRFSFVIITLALASADSVRVLALGFAHVVYGTTPLFTFVCFTWSRCTCAHRGTPPAVRCATDLASRKQHCHPELSTAIPDLGHPRDHGAVASQGNGDDALGACPGGPDCPVAVKHELTDRVPTPVDPVSAVECLPGFSCHRQR